MWYVSLAGGPYAPGQRMAATADCPSVELLQLVAETGEDARLLGQLNAVLAADPPGAVRAVLKAWETYGAAE